MNEYIVEVQQEIYQNNDFHIYVGNLINEYNEEVSLKTDGFTLSSESGKKIIMADEEKKYKGKRSLVVRYEKTDFEDPEVQRDILTNMKGVGEAKANEILDKIGNILKLDENYDTSKLKIKGFGKKTLPILLENIRKVIEDIKTNNLFNELQILFCKDLKPKKVNDIAACIQNVSELYENPYQIMIDKSDIPFKKADEIALSILHIDENNPERIDYLIANILNRSIQGNTYMDLDDLVELVSNNNIKDAYNKIITSEKIKIDDKKCYPIKLYLSEICSPEILKDITNNNNYNYKDDIILEYIKEAEEKYNIKHDESQIKAIINCIHSNVSCIVGGAGVGKTSTLKTVLYVLKVLGNSIRCVAPTGKASRRMTEATGYKATTIHSFIYGADTWHDVLIIDEFSMCDLNLFYDLLQVCQENGYKKIIMVGDDGQLPSVQSGNNLFDIIESDTINIAKLTKIHRQGADSHIIKLAYDIRNNIPVSAIKEKDLFFQRCNSIEDYYKSIDKMWVHLKDKYNNMNSFLNDVQFISPLKKGNLGCNAINLYIQKKYNNNELHEYLQFKINDKVMNIKNNRLKDIYNGECGIITEILKNKFIVYFNSLDRYIDFEFSEKENFILAYCCTIHKLQGSEYKYIVMIIESDSLFLDSRILYTGVTRGKETVIILSNLDVFNKIIKRDNNYKRKTYFKERLQECFSKTDGEYNNEII
jgi:exodeoxyribonuclease V alpha subunit